MDVNIGKGITLAVDANALPPNALEHVIRIGLRNILMDSHASVTTDEPDYMAKARAIAETKLAALLSGEVRVSGSREGDPVRAEAKRLAIGELKTAYRKAGKGKLADVEATAWNAGADKMLAHAKHGPRLMAMAQANVEKRREAADGVDLADLLG